MSRSEIILDWICGQVRAGNIKPGDGARLAGLVDMTDATDTAEDIKRLLESVNDFRYMTVGAKRDKRGISSRYNGDMMAKAIAAELRKVCDPSPSLLAWHAIALIHAGIFEPGISKAQARRLLSGMDEARQSAWGSQSAFNDAFFKAQYDMSEKELDLITAPILDKYRTLQDENQ